MSNFLAGDKGRVNRIDFGAATRASDIAVRREDKIIGTLPSTAPEIFLGAPTSSRSDVFSLGCVLYQAATGTPLYNAETLPDLLALHGEVEEHIARAEQRLPLGLGHVLAKCLRLEPKRRYADAGEVTLALRIGDSIGS